MKTLELFLAYVGTTPKNSFIYMRYPPLCVGVLELKPVIIVIIIALGGRRLKHTIIKSGFISQPSRERKEKM